MLDLLWLAPTLPLLGFAVLALAGARLGRTGAAAVGVGSVGLSAVVALAAGVELFQLPELSRVFTQKLWTWFDVAGLVVPFGLHLDTLSLAMIVVITFVGFLIHLYSVEYMAGDESFAKFFAYMNLFVGSMLLLVLADNLLLLYLGWEGVGACSYLLIGFWWRDPANDAAARKAFIVTRVGDAALAIALFILYRHFGTWQIQELATRATAEWAVGSRLAVWTAALLLAGAVGKSAQLPLQTWLPDAMAGPTPVSALIHAATMVTAGVYLIARTHALFELAPDVQLLVAAVGAATLLLAGFAALAQTDIKRVLAYSTISQIGYMFLALGVGAYSAALFHFFTHAFFKALLFLGAGAVILACHHEQNIFQMGGLRRRLPFVFWTFAIGGGALAGFPLVTAGFYSKEWILGQAWAFPGAGPALWAAGLAGALLTALYTTRLILIVFFGEPRTPAAASAHAPGWLITIPLAVLAVGSVATGFLEMPEWLGGASTFGNALFSVFSKTPDGPAADTEMALAALATAVCFAGIAFAYWLYGPGQALPRALASPAAAAVASFWRGGWGFDTLYRTLFVRPFVWLAALNRADAVDLIPAALAAIAGAFHRLVRLSQTGRVRWYAAVIVAGAIAILTLAVWR
jgi:NADH-quinone oxidoreductase subunit L